MFRGESVSLRKGYATMLEGGSERQIMALRLSIRLRIADREVKNASEWLDDRQNDNQRR